MNEQIVFMVEKVLSEELKNTVERVADEAKVIFRANTVHAANDAASDFFINAGKIIKEDGPYGVQRDAKLMTYEIQKQLGKDGRHVLLITATDLTCQMGDRYLNFCFGLANNGHVIISMARFGHLSINEQKSVLAGLIMHELGHIYDLAGNPRRAQTELNLGMHCLNDKCVMRQGTTAETLRRNFSFLRLKNSATDRDGMIRKYYCPLCAADVEKYFLPPPPPKKVTAPPLPPRTSR